MKCIVTNDCAKQYWKETDREMEKVTDCMHTVNIYPEVTGQQMEGFGGAFTEASAYNYAGLDEKAKKEVIGGYFGEDGLRYNLGRLHIGSCDFGLGNYAYVKEGDSRMETFSIDHDREQIIPMIRAAVKESRTPVHFMAAPWSPPAFMKTNGEMNHGGKLRQEYYSAWADYYAKYLSEYAKEGIQVGAVTVQNEPEAVQTWDSCIYTAEEEGKFAVRYLLPALKKNGLSDVEVFIWDHNKEEMYNRAKKIFSEEEYRKHIDGVAVHWYTGDHFEAVEAVKRMYPEKKIYFTEGCVEYSRFADSDDVQKAEMYAHDMIGNFNAGISAFFDWNLLLDEEGGPNHVGNFCAAPVMCEGTGVAKRLPYYYIGHFSRYVKRGAVQVASTRYTDKIQTAAFLNPDGERVVVLLNKTGEPLEIVLREDGFGVSMTIEAHSIVTCLYAK